MPANWRFPFGQPVRKVEQKDRTTKRAFVLGVYASAVHAKWIGADGKSIIRAVAVASEPEIFWRGEGAENTLRKIKIPKEVGRLEPAESRYNGPSGKALDDLILRPLGLERESVWLCDLVPHSCENSQQRKAIESKYLPIASEYGLPSPTVPPVPLVLADEHRRNAILRELAESRSETLILLGDKPIKWFLRYFDSRWGRLADFVSETQLYGRTFDTEILGKRINILPLAHPRQIAGLGKSSPLWRNRHSEWVSSVAGTLL